MKTGELTRLEGFKMALILSVDEVTEKLRPSYTGGEDLNGIVSMENALEVPPSLPLPISPVPSLFSFLHLFDRV